MIAFDPVPGPKPNTGRWSIALTPASHRQSRASKEVVPFSDTEAPLAVPDASCATHGWDSVRCWIGALGAGEEELLCCWPFWTTLGLSSTDAALEPYHRAVRSMRPITPTTLVMP